MIDIELLRKTVADTIAGTNLFIVSCEVAPGNAINVTVDSPTGVDIDTCVEITRRIEETFDRDVEDYELEVGSAGVTAPFSVPEQYRMNIGNPVDILTRDGRRMHATLTAVSESADTITVAVPTKVKEEGAKRPKTVDVEHNIPVADIKSIVRELKF